MDTIDDTMPRGVSEGGMPLHEEDHAEYIGPEPSVFACLVRLTEGANVSYQYRAATLNSEMAKAVTKGADPLDVFREAIEGDVVPGTELYEPARAIQHHADNLRYVARHLNNGGAQPADVVDSAFRNGRLLDAVVALTTTSRQAESYGSTICDF